MAYRLNRQTFLLVLLPIVSIAVLQAQNIRIRVLDGRNGHRVAKEHVQVWIGPQQGVALDLPAGNDGVAELHLDPAGARAFEIASDYFFDCRHFRRNEPLRSYSVNEVLKIGIVTENNCGKVRAEPEPGELIFFVRPLRWWEGVKR